MRPLGAKKTRTHVKGHQTCAICHPATKGGRAAEKRAAYELAAMEMALAWEAAMARLTPVRDAHLSAGRARLRR